MAGIYSPEEKEEQKAIIRRILTMNPTLSLRQIQIRLKNADKPIELGLPYIMDLTREVRTDRVEAIREETKEDIYAQMKDTVEFVNQQLRAIAQEEKIVYMNKDMSAEARTIGQHNRIKAMNSLIDNLMKLWNLKMDLGIIERKVGTMDHNIIDVMAGLKKIRNGNYKSPITELIRIPAPAVQDGGGTQAS